MVLDTLFQDASAFSANRKKNEVEMKKVTELFSNLQNGLKSSNPDIYEKVCILETPFYFVNF